MKKETPQIYKVEAAVAYEETDDELDPEIFTKVLNLSSGIILCLNNPTVILASWYSVINWLFCCFSNNNWTASPSTGTPAS